jgi:hypothetical protein
MKPEMKLPEKQKLIQLSTLLARDIAGMQEYDNPTPQLRQAFELITKAKAMEPPENGLTAKDIMINFLAVCTREGMKEGNPFWNYIRWPENMNGFLIGIIFNENIDSGEMMNQVLDNARRSLIVRA